MRIHIYFKRVSILLQLKLRLITWIPLVVASKTSIAHFIDYFSTIERYSLAPHAIIVSTGSLTGMRNPH